MEQDAFAYVAETAGSTAPRVVFLDTEVFDRAKYNFDSAVLQACADLAESHNLTLLIPRVTEDEIKRHIQERAEKAVDALQKAEKDAPLLKLWHKWPQQFPHQKATLSRSLCDNVSRKLLGFQNRFHVVRLEHEKKELERVLRRYHNGSAPFGTGRKKSEFPDALAIAAVEQYSDNLDLPVAVVSGDSDFQEACRYQDRLFSFASLSSFIDAVLTEDENAEKARKALDADDQLLIEEIREALTDTVVKSWGYDEMIDEQTFEDAVWNDLDLHQLDIIGLGEHEASLRFKGLAGGNIDISFTDYEPWEDDWIPHLISLTDEPFGGVTISGTGSVKLSKDWTHIEEVTQLILEQEEIVLHYDCRNQTVDTYT